MTTGRLPWGVLVVSGLLLSCGHPQPKLDGGTPQEGVPDAGATDAGDVDAGSTDAGSVDGGSVDAGFNDAGSDDAGAPDAGPCPGVDLQTDVQNCGACNVACAFPQGSADCVAGLCVLTGCDARFFDLDADAGDGCEYGCSVTNGGVEICDGLDNDCNGAVDDSPQDPNLGSACGGDCPGGTVQGCVGTCQPGTTVCVDGGLLCAGSQGPTQEVCDHLDNDCNGLVDDPFTAPMPMGYQGGDPSRPLYNSDVQNCGGCNGLAGYDGVCGLAHATNACRSNAPNQMGSCDVVTCNSGYAYVLHTDSDPTRPSCNVNTIGTRDSQPGLVTSGRGCFYACPVTTGPTQDPELCNGVDDDCDGCIDNGWHDLAASVSVPAEPDGGQGAHTVFIAQYEASRLDGTASSQGSQSLRACSVPSRLPWTGASHDQAALACQLAGGRLCSEWEWQTVCEGSSPPKDGGSSWSESSSPQLYQAGVCNDADAGTGGATWPTGMSTGPVSCASVWTSSSSVHDLSGNAAEWTGTPHLSWLSSGTNGILSFVSAGTVQLTDPAGLPAAVSVGDRFQISGSPTPSHNGVFSVVQKVSSTALDLANPAVSSVFTPESGLSWSGPQVTQYALRGGSGTSLASFTSCQSASDVQPSSFSSALAGFRCCFDQAP